MSVVKIGPTNALNYLRRHPNHCVVREKDTFNTRIYDCPHYHFGGDNVVKYEKDGDFYVPKETISFDDFRKRFYAEVFLILS